MFSLGFSPGYAETKSSSVAAHAQNNKSASDELMHVQRSKDFLDKGNFDEALEQADMAIRVNRMSPHGYYARANVYQAMGWLEKAQEAAMHAALLDPKSETLKEYVLGLSRDIERTDYHCSTALPLSHQHKTASDVNLLAWTEEEEPTNWSKKEVTETLNKSIPLTCLDALERAVIAKLLSPSFLQQERLCIHILGATSEAEGISDYKVIFDFFPNLVQLEIVQVGYMELLGPMRSLVSDPQAPPSGQLVTEKQCLGKGKNIIIRKWHGPYHHFLQQTTRHQVQGFLHESPHLVLIPNPRFDVFFDMWAPTIACLRDAGYLTVVTGGNKDRSRRMHNIIMQSLHTKIVMRLKTSRFGVHSGHSVKNHNMMGFRGRASLPTPPPVTTEDFVHVKKELKKFGVEVASEGQDEGGEEEGEEAKTEPSVWSCRSFRRGGDGRVVMID